MTSAHHHQGATGASLIRLPVPLPFAEQQYISDILGLINHGDPQIRGATAILCGAILQAALTKTRYSIQPWLASVQSATGLSVCLPVAVVNFARAVSPLFLSSSLTNLSVLLRCRQHSVPGGLGAFVAKDFKRWVFCHLQDGLFCSQGKLETQLYIFFDWMNVCLILLFGLISALHHDAVQ